ncbi:hypothetical protein EDB86DRAFT_3082119 [Lactarius hatsudake]|nr:hypothetical protein EDB86DRAFT_3082119 [Lactarius hatsudake]
MPVAVSEAQALAVSADARKSRATLERLDVLNANLNAGDVFDLNQKLGDKDPERWWNTFEVNIRGIFNVVRYVLTAVSPVLNLDSEKGATLLRFLCASDYAISRHAVNRLVEFISLVFALHPGYIKTQLSTEGDDSNTIVFNAVQLLAATMLYLTPGCIDGKFLSSNSDLGGVERDRKEKVQVMNAFVNELTIPK